MSSSGHQISFPPPVREAENNAASSTPADAFGAPTAGSTETVKQRKRCRSRH
jgi:hypothetical protein